MHKIVYWRLIATEILDDLE